MRYFAWQRGPSGIVPVAFDEHPKLTPTMARDLIQGSIREIPEELREASLSDLAAWARRPPS